MFSRRLPRDLTPTVLARRLAERAGDRLDLTVTNPTRCGLSYPADLLEPLVDPRGLVYTPEPRGLATAREAVAASYRRCGVAVDPETIVLTASTSEAYALLFKLLCDPADAILVPRPSYPLFEHLAALEGVVPLTYSLEADAHWQPRLEARPGSRAVVAVHPNNPTGSYLHRRARSEMLAFCRAQDAALVVDEVFFDYPLEPVEAPESFAPCTDVLTFTLGGLSKFAALPQLKLAWIVVSGPESVVREALARLEFLADQYLSVSTPVQLALSRLLDQATGIREAVRVRCRTNLEGLRRQVARVPEVQLLPPAGGWSALLRFPCVVDEEALIVELLERDGVAIHPGFFFDFPDEGWLVASLLPEPAAFAEAVRRVLARIAAHCHNERPGHGAAGDAPSSTRPGRG